MKIKIQGSRNGVRWPDVGGVVDLPDGEANDLIAQDFAVKVGAATKSADIPTPEKAVAPTPEKRAPARKKS